MAAKKLYRSRENRVIAGVAGGLAEYFDIDPLIVRIIFILLAISQGIGILLYLIGWIAIPEHPDTPNKREPAEEIKEKAEQVASDIREAASRAQNRDDRGSIVGGLILLILGVIFLLNNLFDINIWANFWPLLLIAIGLGIILTSRK